MRKKLPPHLALLATNIFFGINLSAVKHLVNNGYMKAFGLNLVRIGISTLLLWILFLIYPTNIKIKKEDLPRFIMCAITGIVINQLLFVKGLSLTFSIHAALLMLTTPILITVMASWLLKEKLTMNKLIGLFLGISGASILIGSRTHSNIAENVLLGDTLIIINAISYTIYFILVKPLMATYKPVDVIRIVFTIGLILAFPFCWAEFKETRWERFQFNEWATLGLVVIGGTFLAYLFNIYGIKKLGASIAGAYIYSQPAFGTIIAVLFLKENIELYKIIAAVFIFTGVYLANKNASSLITEKLDS